MLPFSPWWIPSSFKPLPGKNPQRLNPCGAGALAREKRDIARILVRADRFPANLFDSILQRWPGRNVIQISSSAGCATDLQCDQCRHIQRSSHQLLSRSAGFRRFNAERRHYPMEGRGLCLTPILRDLGTAFSSNHVVAAQVADHNDREWRIKRHGEQRHAQCKQAAADFSGVVLTRHGMAGLSASLIRSLVFGGAYPLSAGFVRLSLIEVTVRWILLPPA